MKDRVPLVAVIGAVPGGASVAVMQGLWWLAVPLVVGGMGGCWYLLVATPRRKVGLLRPSRGGDRAADAAAAAGLGDFVRVFQADWSVSGLDPRIRGNGWPWTLALLVLTAMPVTAYSAGLNHELWLGALAIPVGMAAGWISTSTLRGDRTMCVLQYRDGFVCRGERGVAAFRWRDIEDVRMGSLDIFQRHLLANYHCDLRTVDGREARVGSEEFRGLLLGKVAASVRVRALVEARAAAARRVPPEVAGAAVGLGRFRGRSAVKWDDLAARPGACYLYDRGIVMTGRRGRVQFFAAWDEMASVYWQRRASRSHPSGRRIWVLAPGLKVVMAKLSDGMGGELLGRQAAAIAPGLTRRLRKGETLRFGPFLLGPAGVADGAATVPWEKVTGCELERGLVSIGREGAPGPAGVPERSVPDMLALERVVRAFAGRPWQGAPGPREPGPGPGGGHAVRGGWPDRVLAFLTPLTVSRLAVGLGGGVGVAVAVEFWLASASPPGDQHFARVLLSFFSLPLPPLAYVCADRALRRRVWAGICAVADGRTSGPRRSLAVAAAVAALAVGVACWLAGPGAVLSGINDAILTVLPAALAAALCVWTYVLTSRRVRSSGRRLLRRAADLPVAAMAGTVIVLAFDRSLLAHEPASVVFFLLGGWCAVRTWLVMNGSERLAARAGADIVGSLLLGTDLVLFGVWAANAFGLSEPEVAAARGALQRAGSLADLPWWVWLVLLVILAGASLAFARWPVRLKAAIRWSGRLRVVPSVDVGRRLLSGVHLGLLVVVLVGLSAPASLETALRGPLRTSYAVALQREWEDDGELAAYAAIRREFTPAAGRTVPSTATLAAVVSEIRVLGGQPGDAGATSADDDLARRVGQIQASALGLIAPASVQAATSPAADAAGFDEPVSDAGDLETRLGKVETEKKEDDATARQVDRAAELAAAAVASTIQIPGLGGTEVVAFVREYLGGLIEDSPLKDVFASWARRLIGSEAPPDGAEVVVPDPVGLVAAATEAVAGERVSAGLTDPSAADPATLSESTIADAVDLANQARLVAEGSTSCYECAPDPGVEEQPVQPDEEVPYEAPHEVEP